MVFTGSVLVRGSVGAAIAMIVAGGVAAGPAHSDPPAVIGGGSGIALDTGEPDFVALCTLTAVGFDREDRLVGITAGHCADGIGLPVWAEAVPQVGTIGVVAAKDVDHDWAVIELDPARVTPVRQVGPTVIASVGAPAQAGEVVCKNGRTTGYTCGMVWGAFPEEFISQVCAGHGDSGGPVLRGDQLIGMINAGVGVAGSAEAPCTGAGNPLHDPDASNQIAAVLAEIDGIGAVGAGFRPL